MVRFFSFAAAFASFALGSLIAEAQDWPRFLGPNGNGVAAESESLPVKWSPNANLAWKTELPGPGASSPIIVDGKVFVTCYSGYGLDQENPGNIENLMRHLVCVDLKSGKKLWQKNLKAAQPEDPFTGAGVPAHGYASHTPVSDGENVYAFFGKSGVYAYDLEGNQLWHTGVGMESDPNKWGTSSSPIVHEDTVIVTAAAESQAIVGLDRETGEEIWRQEATGLDNMWGTPALVEIDEDRTDLVMCVPGEMWGLDPATGKLRWYADATDSEHSYSSVIHDDQYVYAFTGRGGGSIAIKAGGKGDVSESNTVWTGRDNAAFASPVRHGSKIYVISRNIITVVDAETGDRIQRMRLEGAEETGGQFGSLDYPSPVIVGGHLYYLNGSGQMFVFELGDELELVAVNRVTSEKEIFRGTPAVSDDQMVLRSQKHLYCVTDQGDEVDPADNQLAQIDTTDADEEQSGGERGGNRQFDPMELFNRMDTNDDEKLTSDELEGNPMSERFMELDKDENKEVSKEEFRTGITALINRLRQEQRNQADYENQENAKPERPERPEPAWDEDDN